MKSNPAGTADLSLFQNPNQPARSRRIEIMEGEAVVHAPERRALGNGA